MERTEAIKLCLTKYETGRPCKNGHNGSRYSVSGICTQCAANYQKAPGRRLSENRKLIEAQTVPIFLHVRTPHFEVIKVTLDGLIAEHMPAISPHAVNPYPFIKAKFVADNVYQIAVRVPPDKVDYMYEFGKNILAM